MPGLFMPIKSSAGVVRLNQLTRADDFPAYVAIYTDKTDFHAFALSPTVMQWSASILLCKVSDCEPFWLAQQQKQGCDLAHLFNPLLRHHYGEAYMAVFGHHPWQCLLYLAYQISQRGSGIYFLQSALDQNIYKSLSWHFWFGAQEALITHLENSGAKRFKPEEFRVRQAKLKRFIARIGLAGPVELKQASPQAITRRFDVWIGKIWRWTFARSPELQAFPWIALTQKQVPNVQRELEYPVNQWAHIEVLLREDMARLCDQFKADASEHINRMLWQITLFSDQVIDVNLSFRHPYALHRDAPAFSTVLYQACYVYDALIRQLQRRDKDLDLPEMMPFMGWRIEVCERIHLPPQLWDLFANDEAQIQLSGMRELQNKLPVPIEAYRCEANFYPEQSFQPSPVGGVAETPFDDYQWSRSSSHRPLFYYPSAHEIETPVFRPGTAAGFFLERGASRWWSGGDPENQARDYYVLKDHRGRSSWAYRDFDGKWFKQGEYV